MLRMKCSAYWIYYDIPHIDLFSDLHIIYYKIVEKIKYINLIEKIWSNHVQYLHGVHRLSWIGPVAIFQEAVPF